MRDWTQPTVTKKPWRTKTERKRLRQLKLSETANQLVLNTEGNTARARQNAEADLRRIGKERAKLDALYEARKTRIKGEAIAELNAASRAEVEAKFRELPVAPVGDERDALMAEMEAHSATLVGEHTVTARAYLQDRIAELKAAKASETEESAEELEKRENEEFVVVERVKEEIISVADSRLLQSATIPIRRAMRAKLRKMAGECLSVAKGPEADEIDAAMGVRKKIVAEAQAEAYESIAKRLSIFGEEWPRYLIEDPPSDDDMEELHDFYYSLGCAPQNWNCRSPDGRITEEQCLLRFAVARYFQRYGYSVDDLPKVPLPTFIPSSRGQNLDFDLEQQTAEQIYRYRRQHEFVGERNREVEQFIRLTPAKLDKLAETKPAEYNRLLRLARTVPTEDDSVTVYRVHQSTVEQPHLPYILYWPLGNVVKVGQEILWCKPLGCYVLPPEIAADPLFGVPTRMEAEQDLEGKWVWKPVSIETSRRYVRDSSGKFHPISGNKPQGLLAEPIRVTISDGDHIPWPNDPRHPNNGGAFRLGHWYTRAEIEASEQMSAGVSPPLPPIYAIGPITKIFPPDVPTRDGVAWGNRENQIQEELLKENSYA